MKQPGRAFLIAFALWAGVHALDLDAALASTQAEEQVEAAVEALQSTQGQAEGQVASPLMKVVGLMTSLQAQVIGEDEFANALYKEKVGLCTKTSKKLRLAVTAGGDEVERLKAAIDQGKTTKSGAQALIDTLSGKVSIDAADLKAIKLIRAAEKDAHNLAYTDLSVTIDTIRKAIEVLTKQQAKAKADLLGGSFLQQPTKGMDLFVRSLAVIVDTATGVSEETRTQLSDFLQTDTGEESDETGETVEKAVNSHEADPKKAYNSKSGAQILKILEDMKKQADTNQFDLARSEQKTVTNYELTLQNFNDRIKLNQDYLDKQKQEKAAAMEQLSKDGASLGDTQKDLKKNSEELAVLQVACMTDATNFATATKTRASELKALASAKKTVQAVVFAQMSLLQVKKPVADVVVAENDENDIVPPDFLQLGLRNDANMQEDAIRSVGDKVITHLKQLAADEHSAALVQLVSRVSSTMLYQRGRGTGVFTKIKKLIADMIAKLEKKQKDDQTQGAYCKKELAETKDTKGKRESTIEKLTTRIDKMNADASKNTRNRLVLMGELSDLAAEQKKMDGFRKSDNVAFVKTAKALKGGITAVQTALKILRDFYSQGSSFIEVQDMSGAMKASSEGEQAAASASQTQTSLAGAGGGAAIIKQLEIVESDFARGLAEATNAEDQSLGAYTKMTQANKVSKAEKDTSIKHIGTRLAKFKMQIAEMSSDRTQTKAELLAITQYLEKLNKQCSPKKESYAVKKARREREIAGLEMALAILKNPLST